LWRKTWPQMDQLRSLSSREFRHWRMWCIFFLPSLTRKSSFAWGSQQIQSNKFIAGRELWLQEKPTTKKYLLSNGAQDSYSGYLKNKKEQYWFRESWDPQPQCIGGRLPWDMTVKKDNILLRSLTVDNSGIERLVVSGPTFPSESKPIAQR
jgi:hypothetical protein